MQRWPTRKVGYPINDDSLIVVAVPNLFSVRTEPTSPEKAEAEGDTCANEQGKSTTYQGELLAFVMLIVLLIYRDGCRTAS